MVDIPLQRSYIAPRTERYLREALADGKLSGGGRFTAACQRELEALTGSPRVLLTQSGTTALEMCALLLDLQPGDEVIMPSFTFPSTANAFVLRRAVPVFVDIRPDTLNIDEALVEAAISARTRAIVVVHYAGVVCEMDPLLRIARKHGLPIIEDAAQALGAHYRGAPAGSLGDLAALSFHATKNIGCGEGGALLINNTDYIGDAEIIWDKGTDRAAFLRGERSHYEWRQIGSSCLPSEITAAVLLAQLETWPEALGSRRKAWAHYQGQLEGAGIPWVLPQVPRHCEHNAHIYFIRCDNEETARRLQQRMDSAGVAVAPHYQPLHLSEAGRRYTAQRTPLPETEKVAGTLLRLPLWNDMPGELVERVIDALLQATR